MFDVKKYEWAVTEALKEWEGDEGGTSEWIAAAERSDSELSVFEAFLVKWGVSRTILGDKKRALYWELVPT